MLLCTSHTSHQCLAESVTAVHQKPKVWRQAHAQNGSRDNLLLQEEAPEELLQETISLQEVLLTAHMARAYDFPLRVSRSFWSCLLLTYQLVAQIGKNFLKLAHFMAVKAQHEWLAHQDFSCGVLINCPPGRPQSQNGTSSSGIAWSGEIAITPAPAARCSSSLLLSRPKKCPIDASQ